ncbi:AAA family ATPase [Streptomyces sp. NPDC004610]|uniref:helix-turn-helix transcriptional regulator n=1 Tax=unclassified Streptomyces TaxID=2593676 RepID=UPI00339E8BAD
MRIAGPDARPREGAGAGAADGSHGRLPGHLHGRGREIAALEHLVQDARTGRSRTLVLHGEAGIGKSALLDRLQTASPGVRVVRVDGVACERTLPFAAVQRLCASLRADLPALAAPQRHLLERVAGLHSSPAPSSMKVGLALHGLLSAAARRQALVGLFDDAHQLDEASRVSVAVAVRRCTQERVAVVFALPTAERRDELASFDPLSIGGLPEQAAHALLADRLRIPLDARIRERLVADARGNPRALLAVGAALSPTEMVCVRPRASVASVPVPVPPERVRQLSELTASARLTLLVAAAEPLGDVVTVLKAVRYLGVGQRAVAEVQSCGLVEFGTRVRFAHPLVRTSAYAAAGIEERRAAHRALAQACDPLRVEQRAWHCGQAASSLDDAVATRIEAAAELVAVERDPVTAAALWELSAGLTGDRGQRAARLLAGARARHRTGGLEQTLELLDRVHTSALPDEERTEAEALRAQTRYSLHRDADAAQALHEVALRARSLGPEVARGPLLEVLAAAIDAGRFCPTEDLAVAARAAHDRPGSVSRPHDRPGSVNRPHDRPGSVNRPWDRPGSASCPAEQPRSVKSPHDQPRSANHPHEQPGSTSRPHELLLEAMAVRTLKGYPAAVTPMRHAVDAYLTAPAATDLDAHGSWLVCLAAVDLWDGEAWQRLADRRTGAAREDHVLPALPPGLAQQALVRVHQGRLTEAAALVAEADGISGAIGATPIRHAALAVAAWSGDEARLRALVADVSGDAGRRAEGRLLSTAEWARAVHLNSVGRYAAALDACADATARDEPALRAWLLPELLEAGVRGGRPEEAATAAARLEECARLTGTGWAVGLHLRARALLAEGSEADEFYRGSARQLTAAGAVLEAGRTHLLWGEWLRRTGRPGRARVPLQAAYEIFGRAGARSFAARCAGELAAAGARPARGTRGAPTALTAQEQRVADRVARGETSKEVAAALLLSPRTVDAHLRGVFLKLGISSRRELRDRSGAGGWGQCD